MSRRSSATAWCAASRSFLDGLRRAEGHLHGRADFGAGRQGHARPPHERARPPDRWVGPIKSDKLRSIHQTAPKFDELSPSVDLLETGIKVIDLSARSQGGKVGLFGARRGQDRNMLELINNIATQHSGLSCSPASASAPARATTSITR